MGCLADLHPGDQNLLQNFVYKMIIDEFRETSKVRTWYFCVSMVIITKVTYFISEKTHLNSLFDYFSLL